MVQTRWRLRPQWRYRLGSPWCLARPSRRLRAPSSGGGAGKLLGVFAGHESDVERLGGMCTRARDAVLDSAHRRLHYELV
jgi:hypothetical protein